MRRIHILVSVVVLLVIGMSFSNPIEMGGSESRVNEKSTRGVHEGDSIRQDPANWSEEVRLSNWSTARPYYPHMAAYGSAIHVAWEDLRLLAQGRPPEVFYARSTDNGTTWSEEIMLSDDDLLRSGTPRIAVDRENVFVIWVDSRGASAFELNYVTSSDGGETWSENRPFTPNDGFDSENPQAAISGDKVHVVWSDTKLGQYEVYYRNSTDGGSTWSDERRLTYWSSGTDGPAGISVVGSTIHVLFTRYLGSWEAFYMRSDDNGVTWTTPVDVGDLDGYNSWASGLSSLGSSVHVCLVDFRFGPYQIFYRNSTDNGATWNPLKRISNSTVDASQCSIDVDGQGVHIVWYDRKPGNTEIYYRNSTNSGTSWNDEVRLTFDSRGSFQPYVEANSSFVHVMWLDERGGGGVFYRRSPRFPPDTEPPRPPRSLEITLEDYDRDVRIAWKAATDEGRLGGTVEYVISRSNDSSSSFIDLGRVQATGSSSYSFVDKAAGRGNSSQFRYYVESVDYSGNRNRSILAGKYILFLDAGKHLISFPVQMLKKKTWLNRQPANAPSNREGGSIAYDSVADRIILFGGGGAFNDTWIYDVTNNTWTEDVPSSSPGKRWGAKMVYCALEGKAVLFGGFWNTYLNDTWTRDSHSGEWEHVSSLRSPSARYDHEMVYVESRNGVILFGGYDGTLLNDTWFFDCSNNHWEQLSLVPSPNIRSKHAMSYDPIRDEVIVFGGLGKGTPSRQGFHNDTWVLDVKTLTWRNATNGRSPMSAWDSRMVYDLRNGKHILFGGYGRIATEITMVFSYLRQTWMYDGDRGEWELLDIYAPPPGRWDHGMVYAKASGKVVLFGGATSVLRNDTWTFELHLNRVFDVATQSFDVVRYYDALDETDHWKEYAIYKTYWDLEDVDNTMGLWVNLHQDDNVVVVGIIQNSTTISLAEGWNLVGYPSFDSTYTVAELKMDTGALRVEGFDSTPPYHLRVLGDAEVLQAGRAYWVYVQSETTWTVDSS